MLDDYLQACRLCEEKKRRLEQMLGMHMAEEEQTKQTWKSNVGELWLQNHVVVISMGLMLVICELLPHVFSTMKGPDHSWHFPPDPSCVCV